MKTKKPSFTQNLVKLHRLLVPNGTDPISSQGLKGWLDSPWDRSVESHELHQREGSAAPNGDRACCQPPRWAEQGKPITETHTARCKWLNGCQNCAQISPELIRGTRGARQLWLWGLFGPEWHWPKRHLIEFCLGDLITWLQPSFWCLISLSRARREMLTHGQKAKTGGTDCFGQALKKNIFYIYILLSVLNYWIKETRGFHI